MGPDSPCPPQCPAGWGKMPKWRPATTLDSPTAGRRRRRLRPSIGNGSPPSPSPLPPRPAVPTPPALWPRGPQPPPPPPHRPELRARGRRGRAPHPPRSRPPPALSPPPAGPGRRRGAAPRGARVGEGWGRGGPLGPRTAPVVKWPPAALERSPAARRRPLGFPRLRPASPHPLSSSGSGNGESERRGLARSLGRSGLCRDAPGAQITCLCGHLPLGPESPALLPRQSLRVTARLLASLHPSPFPVVFLHGEDGNMPTTCELFSCETGKDGRSF